MSYAAFAKRESAAPAAAKDAGKSALGTLRIGEPDDAYEREADRVADEIMTGGALKHHWSLSSMGVTAPLQRKCSCGDSGGADGQCEECKKKEEWQQTVRRKASGTAAPEFAPPVVHEVLNSPGQPLDKATREFFEPRFGRDFSAIRIHSDRLASKSAQQIGARAYTVGSDIVLNPLAYGSDLQQRTRILAHELTHAVQQSTMPGPSSWVSRACLPASSCATPAQGSLEAFVAETEADPANISRQARRKALCGATPVDPGCTGDGHGAPARELQKLLVSAIPARASAIHGVFVDMDIPQNYGAYTEPCSAFTPPISASVGELCTFAPLALEREAAVYNSGARTVGRLTRREWSQYALRVLTHETEHALFAKSPSETRLTGNPCDFDSIRNSLTELAAIISEFKPVHAKALALPGDARKAELQSWFRLWIKGQGENISGSIKDIRCKCDCGDANGYIRNTFRFATKDWNQYELWLYNTTLRSPEWALNWPVDPPDTVPLDQIPSSIPTVDFSDLPKP